jgi:hypothetical protein
MLSQCSKCWHFFVTYNRTTVALRAVENIKTGEEKRKIRFKRTIPVDKLVIFNGHICPVTQFFFHQQLFVVVEVAGCLVFSTELKKKIEG